MPRITLTNAEVSIALDLPVGDVEILADELGVEQDEWRERDVQDARALLLEEEEEDDEDDEDDDEFDDELDEDEDDMT